MRKAVRIPLRAIVLLIVTVMTAWYLMWLALLVFVLGVVVFAGIIPVLFDVIVGK